MTGMLASVTSVDEALLVLDAQVDIIDLKQPSAGALGALPLSLINEIVGHCQGRCPISATIGDLPLQATPVLNAVMALSETGIDYIKIGFFPDGDPLNTLAALAEVSPHLSLIAVLFADQVFDLTLLGQLKKAGFKGVMLDTMNKQHGSLMQHLAYDQLAQFVLLSKQLHLLCGLAGSLRQSDIPELLTLQPDYLGFRGALCLHHERTATLNKAAVAQIRKRILSSIP